VQTRARQFPATPQLSTRAPNAVRGITKCIFRMEPFPPPLRSLCSPSALFCFISCLLSLNYLPILLSSVAYHAFLHVTMGGSPMRLKRAGTGTECGWPEIACYEYSPARSAQFTLATDDDIRLKQFSLSLLPIQARVRLCAQNLPPQLLFFTQSLSLRDPFFPFKAHCSESFLFT